MTGAVGGVLRFGIGAAFKTGTTIGVSAPRALGSTALVLALEVTGLTFPVAGGLRLAGVFGLAGKLEALVTGAAESGIPELELVTGGMTITFGFTAAVSGLVGTTSGFGKVAGFTVLLELGLGAVLEICGFGAVLNVGSLGGELELGLVLVLEAGGLAGSLEACTPC